MKKHGNILAVALAVAFACHAAADDKIIQPKLDLTVSAASVAGGDNDHRLARFFVERLPMGGDFKARFAPGGDWLEIPSGCDAESHVNLLKLVFGKREEFLAFMLNPKGKSVSLAARAPALLGQVLVYYHSYYAPPGDYQMPENAPADLVNMFASVFDNPPQPKGKHHLVLTAWDKEQEKTAGASPLSGEAMSRSPGLPYIYPLAAAAMFAEGYAADFEPGEDVVELGVAVGVATYDIRAELRQGDKKIHQLTRRGIRPEQLYDNLRILLLNLIEWRDTVVDFANPDIRWFTPVCAEKVKGSADGFPHMDSVVIAALPNAFTAFNFGANECIWDTSAERKTLVPACRNGLLFEFSGDALRRIDRSNGKTEFSIPFKGIEDAWQFDARGNITVAGAYRELALYDAGTELWKASLPCSISAGPAMHGEGIILCDDRGRVSRFSMDGKEQGQVQLPAPLRGEIYSADDMFLGCDAKGTLFAIKEDGKLAWSAEIGDVMAGPPCVSDNAVLVPSKSRSLFLLDKATGKCLKEHKFSTWLVGTRVMGDKIFCVGLGKRLSVFDVETLALEKELTFPFDLNPDIIEVDDFSFTRSKLGIGGQTTGFIVSDEKGFLYLCPFPEKEK